MKNLSELAQFKGLKNIEELLEAELNSLSNIKFRGFKKSLAQKLNNLFDGYFLNDYQRIEYGNFLSRALTAYVLFKHFNIPEEEATKYITDDVHDLGIDAIYYFNHTLYVFQTKFSNSISRDDIKEIKDGIKNLLSLEESFENFNEHIKAKKAKLQQILLEDELKIIPVIIFCGKQIPLDVNTFLQQEVVDNPEYGAFIDDYIIINNEAILNYETQQPNITETFTLDKYFDREKPVKMYVGCIKISFLKYLYEKYKDSLFSKNIRLLVDNSSVNKKIKDTLVDEADKFIYYNNGITFVCDNIQMLAHSAASEKLKILKVHNLSIVNGAQTVHSCASVEDISDEALVQVRIIETKTLADGDNLSLKITRFNNSQNAVSPMDLRTLDPIHNEIKKFFIKNNFYYTYRTGEYSGEENNISFEDLMISLGCFYGHSKIVKNSKGELWSNDNLYSDLLKQKNLRLFLTLCEIKKVVDNKLDKVIKEEDNSFIIHWNRLILELVYKLMNISVSNCTFDTETVFTTIDKIVAKINKFINDNGKHKNIYHRQKDSYEDIRQYVINDTVTSSTQQMDLPLFK